MKVKRMASYEEQVLALTQKGLIIEDKQTCENFLKRTNYYRFASYCEAFRYNGKEKFFENTTFEQVKNIYVFDQKIRSLLFEVVEEIEFTLRTQISHYHGNKYGAEGYLNPTNFNKIHDERNFNYHLKTIISENKDSPIVKHHNNKYEGKFPIWVIIEFFSMGMLSRFFKDMIIEDKADISRLYSTNAAFLENWVQCVTEVRNRLAHYSRLYNWRFKTAPCFKEKKLPMEDYSLFGHIVVLRNMYLDYNRWNCEIYPKLINIINEYEKDIVFKHIGFPENWKEYLKK